MELEDDQRPLTLTRLHACTLLNTRVDADGSPEGQRGAFTDSGLISESSMEIEIRGSDPGNQPGTAAECQILDRPLNQDQNSALKSDQIH
jgi:hypothetical protein